MSTTSSTSKKEHHRLLLPCVAAPNKYAFQPVSKLARSIASGELSSRSLLELFISRIERLDDDNDDTNGGGGGFHAVVVRDFERARTRADDADAIVRARILRRKNRERITDETEKEEEDGNDVPLGSLHGVPFTVKESHDASGLPTTLGNPAYKDTIARNDSHVVSALRSAGAILMGKTSVPRNLCDWQSYNELHGICRNPWSRKHTPGGSSGGSAAALCAGLSPIEVGSDIGGSIRLPAHFCGVWGLKPTWNLIDNSGSRGPTAIHAPPELSVVGPMARCASDLILLLDALLSKSSLSSTTTTEQHPQSSYPRLQTHTTLSHLRVAIWADAPSPFAVDTHTRNAMEKVVQMLNTAGTAVVHIDGPPGYNATDVYDSYMDVLCGVYAGRMSNDEYQAAEHLAEIERQNDRGADFWCRQTMSARELAIANERRWGLVTAFEELFHGDGEGGNGGSNRRTTDDDLADGFDVMICPIALSPAFRHDHTPATRPFFTPSDRMMAVESGDGRKNVPYRSNAFWSGICNGSMLPGVAFPVSMAEVTDDDGLTTVRLPVGLQCVGPRRHDYVCIEVARMISMALHGTEFMPLGNPDGCE